MRRYAGREGAALSPLQGRFYRAARRLAGRERLLRGGALAGLLLLTLASLGAAWWASRAEALAERQRLVALDAIAQRTYETVDKLAKVAGTSQVLGELIQNNVELLDRLLALDPADARTQDHRIANLQRAADAWMQLGDTGRAKETMQRLLEITRGRAAADPGNREWQRDLSVSHEKLGDLALALGDTAAAREAYRQALAIRERLAAADPGNGEWQHDLLASYFRIGGVRLAAGETAEALEAADKCVSIARRLADADPSNPRRATETAAALKLRGEVHDAQGHLDLATDDYREAAKLTPDAADGQGALGWALIRLGRFAEARAPAEQAHRLAPTDVNWTINLGHTYLLAGDPAAARPYYDASIAQIPDAAALARGPVADFELFIAKGWQVKACRAALARMREGFARRAPAKPAGGAGP
ncbi:tetratricopeptide repeat protein [uncultured Thiodictyon sp.]|uniref:tetratricopeptide repeat protein n=1 Tax=uncultured Thiodictyon sp. TaxID=1846217 RepID=UPI0025F31A59|nr:tetratricopeptide repeat protein [uncultured Thiodictyon sp.]